ncbi:MAG: periplasmic heavy metal sensor [Pseudomonadota bacterium]
MSGPAQTTSPPSRMWMRLAFFMSLAMNLLVVGVIAGIVLSGGPRRDGPRGLADRRGGPFVAVLPEDIRSQILHEMARASFGTVQMRRDARTRFNRLLAILRAEEFDAQAFSSELAGQDLREGRIREAGRTALIRAISEMSAEERAHYARLLEERLPKRRRSGRG